MRKRKAVIEDVLKEVLETGESCYSVAKKYKMSVNFLNLISELFPSSIHLSFSTFLLHEDSKAIIDGNVAVSEILLISLESTRF